MPTFAPNFQYPEDIPHTSGDRGTAALVVRKDIEASIAGTDGDYTLLQVDASGSLRVIGTVTVSGGTVVATQGTTPWVVGATNFDIRDLVFATDKVDVSGSTVAISSIPEVEIKNDVGNPVPVIEDGASTLDFGLQTIIGVAATLIAAASVRKGLVIQNIGTANIRIGSITVTATTGMKLRPGETLLASYPNNFDGAFYAIREGAVNGLVLAQNML